MRPLRLLVLLSMLSACKGERSAPLAAGAGIVIDDEQFQRKISVDRDRIPNVDTPCAADQTVVRTGDGAWRCAEIGTIDVARFESVEADTRAFPASLASNAAEVRALDERVRRLEGRLLSPRYALAGFSCTVDPASYAAVVPQYHGGRISYRSPTTGSVSIYCPIYPVRPLARWTKLGVTARDSDGEQGGESVIAQLIASDRTGNLRTIATVDFSRMRALAEDHTYLTEDISGEIFDFEQYTYYLQVTLSKTVTTGTPAFAGFELFTE